MTYQITFREMSNGLIGIRADVFNGNRLHTRTNLAIVKPEGLMTTLNEIRREYAKHGVTESR